MKLFNYFLRHTSLFVAAVMLVAMAGCSGCDKNGDKREELLKHVANDAILIATVNLQAYIESAGGKVEDGTLTVPAAIERLVKQSDEKDARKALELVSSVKGVNLQSAVLAIYDDGKTKYDSQKVKGSLMLYITDEDDFKTWIKDVGFDEEKDGDYKGYSYSKMEMYIVLNGDIAHVVPGEEDFSDAVEKVKEMEKSADDKELDKWKVEFLCNEKAAATGLVFVDEIEDLGDELDEVKEINSEARVLAFEQIVDGAHIQTTIKALDKDGKPADIVSAANLSTLDPNIFTYFPADYNFFGAMTLNGKLFGEFKSYMFRDINRGMIEALFGDNVDNYRKPHYDEYGYYAYYYDNPLEEAMDSISRTPAFTQPSEQTTALGIGLGITSGASIDFNNPERILNYISTRAALSFSSPGNASNYYKAWSELNMAGESATDQVIEFSPYYLPNKLYMMRKSNDIILSGTRTFDTASHSFPCKLDDAVAFAQVNIPKDDPLMKALPLSVGFGVKIWAVATRNSVTIDMTLTDTEGGFIENLLDLAAKIATNFGGFGRSHADYDAYDYDADTIVWEPESIAVQEEYAAPAEEAAVAVAEEYYY